jgi:hypothetical protein
MLLLPAQADGSETEDPSEPDTHRDSS